MIRSVSQRFFLVGSIAFTTLLSACGTTGPLQAHPSVTLSHFDLKMETSPELNKVHSSEVGQSLVSRRFLQFIPAVKVGESLAVEVSHNGIPISIRSPEGTYSAVAKNSEGTYYKVGGFTASIRVLGKPTLLDTTGGVVVPDDSDSAKYVYRNPDGTQLYFIEPLSKPLRVQKTQKIMTHKDSFTRELIYAGISKNVISVIYREFSNDFARPAFTQEFKYDLSEGKTIGYRGARFEVIEANNTQITYKVLKHLD